MEPYRIILADDHVLIREAIKKSIEGTPDLKVVAEADDGLQLLDLLEKAALPDLIILDISMPNLQGIESAEKIKKLYPQVKILILTMHKSRGHISRALSAGVDGYLLKENAVNDLIFAIKAVQQGESYISSLVHNQVADIFRRQFILKKSDPLEPLSAREIGVLALFSEGKSIKEIADSLAISYSTVNNHIYRIKKKLNIRNNVELIKYAIQRGYS